MKSAMSKKLPENDRLYGITGSPAGPTVEPRGVVAAVVSVAGTVVLVAADGMLPDAAEDEAVAADAEDAVGVAVEAVAVVDVVGVAVVEGVVEVGVVEVVGVADVEVVD